MAKIETVEEKTRKASNHNKRVKAQADATGAKLFVIRTPLYGTEEQKNQEPYWSLQIDPQWIRGPEGQPIRIDGGAIKLTLGEGVTENEHWARWVKANYPSYNVYEYSEERAKFAPLDVKLRTLSSKLDKALAENDLDEPEEYGDEDEDFLPDNDTPTIEK